MKARAASLREKDAVEALVFVLCVSVLVLFIVVFCSSVFIVVCCFVVLFFFYWKDPINQKKITELLTHFSSSSIPTFSLHLQN